MRLLFLSFYFRPDLCAGSFRASALIDALREAGEASDLEIDLVTTLPNRYATFSEEAAERESYGKVNIWRIDLPSHRSDMIGQSRAFVRYARRVLDVVSDRQYDMVFATSSRLLTATLGAYVSRRKKVPLYLDVRDIFVDTIRDIMSPIIAFPAGFVFGLVERYTMSRASKINLVSAGFEDYFRERYPNITLSMFTNGIDSEFVDLPKHAGKKTAAVTRILYAGNIGEGQCLHDIVPQLARALGERAEILVIGDGGRRQQLMESIEAHGVRNVIVRPPVARAELIDEYQSADVLFLHLGDYQAFEKVLPSKLFEYGALGKPVLAGVAGFAAKFVESEISNSAVFPPGNWRLARQAFESLQLSDQSREDFIRKYSRDRISAEMATEIIAVAASKTGSRVLITGATGFIGSALLRDLEADARFDVLGTSRRPTDSGGCTSQVVQVGELGARTDWQRVLPGIDAIVHTAARVHQLGESPADVLEKYRGTNVVGTARLAEAAVQNGVRRFVFLSSVKVNGERTEPGTAFDIDTTPAPIDPYGVSKLEAEQELRRLGSSSGMEIVIIRPTLVYGPGVGANFEALMRWVYRGVPLPLAGIRNRRSMIALQNLVGLIKVCLEHPDAPGRLFFAADGEDLSTSDLLQRVGSALARPARLFWLPSALLRGVAAASGQGSRAQRLLESLQVNAAPARQILGWRPAVSVDEGILATATAFLAKVGQ